MTMRALAILVALASVARADGTTEPTSGEGDRGYIGDLSLPRLEIEDCKPADPSMTEDQLRALGAERYERGETLYIQGDYDGAVRELVASYCLIPFYTLLKDIGQAYERKLDYERAIGYLSRYIEKMPPNAARTSQCGADPKEERENITRRIAVLMDLRAHISVQANVPGARVTVQNDSGVKSRGSAGDLLEVKGGVYDVIVEKEGYVTKTEHIVARIGQPYTLFEKLDPQLGTLAVQVTPPDARVFVDDKLVGIGRVERQTEARKVTVVAEAPGRLTVTREVEVLPARTTSVQVDLPLRPQFGRRQLIAYSVVGGGYATGSLLYGFQNTGIAAIGVGAGVAAGFIGSYVFLPDGTPLGTSNLTITASVAGGVAGSFGTAVFTGRQEIIQPVTGASLLLGAGLGYYLGEKLDVKPGDAALINSSIVWGTAAGGLFSLSFAPPRNVGAGLVLSGLGMGTISGVLLTRYFDISRTHALLIDVGGVAGIIGGIATEGLVNPSARGATDNQITDSEREHLANYALAGMAIGLVTAGVLTRNIDAPKVPLRATVGSVTDASGHATATYGVSAVW